MAITSETRAVTAVGDGVNRNWPFTFKIYSVDHLKVYYRIGASAPWTLVNPTDYNLTLGVGDTLVGYDGGTVEYPKAPAVALDETSSILLEVRQPFLQQNVILNITSGFNPKVIERQFDLTTQMLQQVSAGISDLELPPYDISEANMFLKVQPDGSALDWAAIDWISIGNKPSTFPPNSHTHGWTAITDKPSTFPPSAHTHGWTAITDKPAVFPPSAHTHNDLYYTESESDAKYLAIGSLPFVTPEMFGAAGDNSTDDTAAINAAIADLPSRGGVVFFKSSSYVVRGRIDMRAGVILEGAPGASTSGEGTRLHLTESASRVQFLGVDGAALRNLVLYKRQPGNAVEFVSNAGNGSAYCTLENIIIHGKGGAALYIEDVLELRVRGGKIVGNNGRAVYLDGRSYNIDAVEFCQTVIAGTSGETNDVITMHGHVSSIKFLQVPVLFGGIGIRMAQSTGPRVPKFIYFANGGFENGSGSAIRIEDGMHVNISNTYISHDSTDANDDTVYFGARTEQVLLQGVIVQGSSRHGVGCYGGDVTINGCQIGNNGRNTTSAAGVRIEGARSAVITGCKLGNFISGGQIQDFGVSIGSGHTAPVIVAHNDLRFNGTSALGGITPPSGSITTPNIT